MSSNIGHDPIPGLSELAPDNCALRLLNGPKAGHQFAINQLRVVIGRSDPPNIQVDIDLTQFELNETPMISRRHALLEWVQGQLILTDLNSTNGTYVNGKPMQVSQDSNCPTSCSIKLNTIIILGNLEFEVINRSGLINPM
ncbi:MAG: FHA domain-containing protein [Crocosphaera sp.]|uniref:FHA domain-containing protein n=1 Tax=Crocosphaera sp. TaxID=2729996 RepID=UPI0025908659|nr:FHA domain-containing protein [Crocosphaera sp.]MCH2245664.1 FHA domain-containing protein [Crocosphaera sp.]